MNGTIGSESPYLCKKVRALGFELVPQAIAAQ